jgi:PIN domain nuclease of toxin-antitoxin system
VRILLDTHVLIHWVASPKRLTREQKRLLERVDAARPALVSEISLLEIATLVRLGRISLAGPLRDWFEMALAPPLVERVGITAPIAAEVAALPDRFHRDPADQVIVATARILGAKVLTNDDRIHECGLVGTVS